MMKVYHLSHIDLDGYSSQYLTSKAFSDITFRNSNYGEEVMAHLNIFCKEIEKDENDTPTLLLITDLNLTVDECLSLEKIVNELKKSRYNLSLQLLDHHKSGEESAEVVDWYYLDSSRCATLITYDYLRDKGCLGDDMLKEYVMVVNAIDIWKNDQVERFKYGKVCLKYIASANETNRYLFANFDVSYKFFLIEKMIGLLGVENRCVKLDDSYHLYKKEFFSDGDLNYTLDDLYVEKIVSLIEKSKDELSIYYKGCKGILVFALGNSSILGNSVLLKLGSEFDFYMDVGVKGSFSARADFKCDVSLLAKELGRGGGHANASGGRISNFKDCYDYIQVKAQIQNIIDNLSK